LERGMCHTLWHRLDLDFVFDLSNTDACQPTQWSMLVGHA
jgi:hypothetical protein